MKTEAVARSEEAAIGHAGLSWISEMARISGLDDATRGITRMKQPRISDSDILRSLCGLIARAKPILTISSNLQRTLSLRMPWG